MPNSSQMRRLSAAWLTNAGWPKRLQRLTIAGLRGWTGQGIDFPYPIMAVVGENGAGKSTILQAAASVYRTPDKRRFASDFFPNTYWEQIEKASIQYWYRQGQETKSDSVRKPGPRWRGSHDRPERRVAYIDLSRLQPIAARVGYTRLLQVQAHHKETSTTSFDQTRLDRFSQVMGQHYESARIALTDAHLGRPVPVLRLHGATYSGFHQGAGETTVAELLESDLPKYTLVLIDEIESSLHPRAQRRLIRDLADQCREREWQVILTTHPPYILSELPPEARAYIMQIGATREIVYGVSPQFAMTNMDEILQPECDIYVEDPRVQTLLTEVLAEHGKECIQRCQIIPYGAASVGRALGQMVAAKRFPRPSRVFLDGDQPRAPGCDLLPGDDAPERVVFEALRKKNWAGIAERVGRPFSQVADQCGRAMTLNDHHEWIGEAANNLVLPGDILWQAMCAEWTTKCLSSYEAKSIVRPISDALIGLDAKPVNIVGETHPDTDERPVETIKTKQEDVSTETASPSVRPPLFELLPDVPQE